MIFTFLDEDDTQGLKRQGRRFTLAVPITDPLGLRPGNIDEIVISFN